MEFAEVEISTPEITMLVGLLSEAATARAAADTTPLRVAAHAAAVGAHAMRAMQRMQIARCRARE